MDPSTSPLDQADGREVGVLDRSEEPLDTRPMSLVGKQPDEPDAEPCALDSSATVMASSATAACGSRRMSSSGATTVGPASCITARRQRSGFGQPP
jgi:hypothetical protein